VILVSQPARPSQFRRQGSDVYVRNPGFAGYAVALSLVNDATGALCKERRRECHFIDLASELSFEDDDFYDNVHTTPAGARRIGEFLSDRLLPIPAGRRKYRPAKGSIGGLTGPLRHIRDYSRCRSASWPGTG